MFGWPITKLAEALSVVGIVLKIRTRLLPVSAINNFVPSEVIELGEPVVFAAAAWKLTSVKLGLPITKFAVVLFAVGILLNTRTRSASTTKSLLPKTAASGEKERLLPAPTPP